MLKKAFGVFLILLGIIGLLVPLMPGVMFIALGSVLLYGSKKT